MYTINKDIRKPTKAINRFPEIIQECWQQYHDDIATGDRTDLPATVDVVLRFYDAIWNRKSVNLRHVLTFSKEVALSELDCMSGALIRSSIFAGYEEEDTALSVCKSTFVDYSQAVGVAMCVTILTPGATFKDIAGLRNAVTDVLETVYGHIGCATPYQSGRGNMYVTKYMITCARSVIGLYSHVPAILSHIEEEAGQ
jgi:hypothetical protein